MSQDVTLGIIGAVTQADLAPIRQSGRLGDYAVIYRIERIHQGGGYGDQDKHPLSWAVAVYIDGQLCRLFNARGAGREWNSLDNLSSWLCEQGFWYWWTRNDIEPLGTATTDAEDEQYAAEQAALASTSQNMNRLEINTHEGLPTPAEKTLD